MDCTNRVNNFRNMNPAVLRALLDLRERDCKLDCLIHPHRLMMTSLNLGNSIKQHGSTLTTSKYWV